MVSRRLSPDSRCAPRMARAHDRRAQGIRVETRKGGFDESLRGKSRAPGPECASSSAEESVLSGDERKGSVASLPEGGVPTRERRAEDGEQLPPSSIEATEGAAGPVRAAGAAARADRPGGATPGGDRAGAVLPLRVSLLPDHGLPPRGGPRAGARGGRRPARPSAVRGGPFGDGRAEGRASARASADRRRGEPAVQRLGPDGNTMAAAGTGGAAIYH